MSTASCCHDLTWATASPLWGDDPLAGSPALLSFASDRFMEDLFTLLASPDAPQRLAERAPKRDGAGPAKLYQAVHGCFHLIAASLVCRRPGFPDHPINPSQREKASFVLRRKVGGEERAWIPPARTDVGGRWQRVDDPFALAEGEELLSLFPVAFVLGGRRRRLLAGVVPTSSRETFAATLVSRDEELGDDGETALSSAGPTDAPLVPKLGQGDARFVIRCVFQKLGCEHRAPLLSVASEEFLIASYFDPDAPARPIRISLPIDPSSAAVGRMNKNVAFALSRELAAKLKSAMNTVGSVKAGDGTLSVQPPCVPGAGGFSLSIPIVTTVAMIVLFIVASILELVFGWLSLIFKCLPSLKLKPKE